jgi:hypothetical protein
LSELKIVEQMVKALSYIKVMENEGLVICAKFCGPRHTWEDRMDLDNKYVNLKDTKDSTWLGRPEGCIGH